MILPLLKGKVGKEVAVFSPFEWRLIESKLNADYKIRFNFLMYTGMRISEARYVSKHPDCFREANEAIFLPYIDGERRPKKAPDGTLIPPSKEEKLGKVRAKMKDRAVLLNDKGVAATNLFFDQHMGFPTYQAMEGALKRAARAADFDVRNIYVKSTRKTWVSWLLNTFPEQEQRISLSMGHDRETMQYYSVVQGFKKDDYPDMRAETKGWGTGRD